MWGILFLKCKGKQPESFKFANIKVQLRNKNTVTKFDLILLSF